MKYPLHTTTMKLRLSLMEKQFELQDINIDDFLVKTLAINEDTNELYEVDYTFMLDTLREFDEGIVDFTQTSYYKHWVDIKGADYCRVRVSNFIKLYKDIKTNGLQEPVSVEITGQKLDGSHRACVMKHLGYKTIPARVFKLLPEDLDDNFIKRTLEARYKLYGKNYYFIDYGEYTNIEKSQVYSENSYDRWEVLKDLINGNTIDLGCNEGYIAIQNAIAGRDTIGYEYEFADGANFNKIIFERKLGKLPVKFIDGNITDTDLAPCDTCLMLNVIYHIPKDKQVDLIKKIKAKQIIFQCNLRKEREKDRFRGCTVDGVEELCKLSGRKITKIIQWRDKPIVIVE